MAKRASQEPSSDQQQPYDNLLKSVFEGQEKQMLLHKAIDEMVKYYKGNNTKLAEELRWMGIALRRVRTLPRNEKREIQERLNMWDDLMERDPKMRKIRKESEAKGEALGLIRGLRTAVITVVTLRFPPLTELAQRKVSRIRKPEKLNLLLEQVMSVSDEDAARLLFDDIAA